MQNKTVLSIILYWFNWLMIKITSPKNQVEFLKYRGSKKEFFKNLPTWLALLKVDKIIDDFIKTHNRKIFKGKSLYEIKSFYTLKNAMDLIQYGIAKEEDFAFAGKPVSVITDFDIDFFDPFYRSLQQQDWIKEIARKVTENEKDFSHLISIIAQYKSEVWEHWALTNDIDNAIEKFEYGSYLGSSLYDITDYRLAKEGIKAIEQMRKLQCEGINKYKGISIVDLNLFTLKKIRLQLDKNDFTGIEFDEVQRGKYLTNINLLQDKRELGNAQARARRAKLKAEKQAAAKKELKQKPNKKVIKGAGKGLSKSKTKRKGGVK